MLKRNHEDPVVKLFRRTFSSLFSVDCIGKKFICFRLLLGEGAQGRLHFIDN